MTVGTRLLHAAAGVALLTAMALGSTRADAQTGTTVRPVETNVGQVVALANVRVRSGPGTEFSVLGGLAAGTVVPVSASSDPYGWWRVPCPDGPAGPVTGCWISAEFVQPPAGVFGDPNRLAGSGGDGAGWRLVASDAYGFRLEVPPTGTLADPMGARPQGPCGTSVREGPAATYGLNGALIDNLVFVEVIDWPGTARAYLDATEPDAHEIDRLYMFRPVVTNADEALLPVPRPGAEWAGGIEGPRGKPLGYVLAVYRKGARLLIVRPLQNPGQPNACVAESPEQLRRIAASLTFVEAEAGHVASQD